MYKGKSRSCERRTDLPRFAFFFPSYLRWDEVIFHRPQQLAISLARLSHPVIYGVPRATLALVPRLAQSCLLVTDWWEGMLQVRGCLGSDWTVVYWFCYPPFSEQASAFRPDLVVFDHIDEWVDEFADWGEGVPGALAAADLVVAVSERLAESARSKGCRVELVRNGVSMTHFRPRMNGDPGRAGSPRELRNLPRPIIGYHGALSTWVDLDLIAEVGRAYPAATVVVVGRSNQANREYPRFDSLPNVHVVGPKPHRDIPSYVSTFDVGLIPFDVRPMTDSSNPIKMYEYLSAAVPVVATDLSECRLQPGVMVARDRTDFVRLVGQALEMTWDERLALRSLARPHTWTARAEKLLGALERSEAAGKGRF
jgi:glycosyltransferase involved in cell wall biosynthesis